MYIYAQTYICISIHGDPYYLVKGGGETLNACTFGSLFLNFSLQSLSHYVCSFSGFWMRFCRNGDGLLSWQAHTCITIAVVGGDFVF